MTQPFVIPALVLRCLQSKLGQESLLLAVYNAVGADYLCAGELVVVIINFDLCPLRLRAFVVYGF